MRAKEFIIREDEYDQFDRPKDPNLLKVNADTYYRTSKADQIFWKPEDFKLWGDRQKKLLVRCRAIYAKLQRSMPEEDRPAVAGIPLDVPMTGVSAWAVADYVRRVIEIDLGCFWDLSDDCLAYTLGHEIGHHVYNYKNKDYWKKKTSPSQNRKYEMDADVYGALLAYELGYDRRKAWDNFDIAYQREPFDPKYPEYPSIGQRKQNVDRALAQKKKDKAAAAQQQAQPAPEPQEAPSSDKPQKDAWLRHIMQGMQKFEVALSQDPNMNLA
jgi:hypothetical protein